MKLASASVKARWLSRLFLSAAVFGAGCMGPDREESHQEFPDTAVRRVGETGTHSSGVALISTLSLPGMPEKTLRRESCSVIFGRGLCCLHELDFGGEFRQYSATGAEVVQVSVPEPTGLVREYSFKSYFENPILKRGDGSGDIFARWVLGGNGDHGLALLRSDAADWRVTRFQDDYLADSKLLRSKDGTYYLLAWLGSAYGSELTVYRLDEALVGERLGQMEGIGHHSIGVLDASFTEESTIHIVWGDVDITRNNRLHVRTIDFDVSTRAWRNNRRIFVLSKFGGFLGVVHPVLVQLDDGTVHYLWSVEAGGGGGTHAGIYYQSPRGDTFQVQGVVAGFDAVSIGNRIVFGYAMSGVVGTVLLRVVENEAVGRPSSIDLLGAEYPFYDNDYFFLEHFDEGRLWFADTRAPNTIYQLGITTGGLR